MIKTKVVDFVVNEMQSVANDCLFEIIDADINTPEFGKVTLYIMENSNHRGGRYFCNYIFAGVDAELPEQVSAFDVRIPTDVGPAKWSTACRLQTTKGTQYFLIVKKT